MRASQDAAALLEGSFGKGAAAATFTVPGRVNLIGEHIDYHNLAVFPMAIQRRIHIAVRPRANRLIRLTSAGVYGQREFEWTARLEPGAAGDWVNYAKAAAQGPSLFQFQLSASYPPPVFRPCPKCVQRWPKVG